MMVALSLVLALALLAGTIYVLRRYQDKVLQEVVAREQPLPPLSGATRDNTGSKNRNYDHLQPSAMEQVPAVEQACTDGQTPAARQAAEPELASRLSPESAADPRQWRERSQALRDAGAYEAALSACEMGWPRWQSYEQAARVIRAAVRALPETGQQERQAWLERLYQMAAQASFLHDKLPDMPDPNWQTLAQRFSHADVTALDMPWETLGYEQLRLLTKSDIKLLTKTRNEPKTHQSARVLHRKQW